MSEERPNLLDPRWFAPFHKVALGELEAIVVHHSQAPASQPIEELRSFHARPKEAPADWPREHRELWRPGRGWGEIAYHRILRHHEWHDGRDLRLAGSHAPGWNSRSWAVCVLGDFLTGDPPGWVIDLVTQECIRLIGLAGKPVRVLSHREAMTAVGKPFHTTCPGMDWVGVVRSGLTRAYSDFSL